MQVSQINSRIDTKREVLMSDLPDRIITSHEVCEIVPYSLMHLNRLERAGKFPRRLRLGPGPTGRVGWRLSEVMQWVEERAAERDPIGDDAA